MINRYLSLACLALVASLAHAQPSPRAAGKRAVEPENAKVSPSVAASDPAATKVVKYGDKDVVRLNAKVRYTTLIVLPKDEEILDFTCGDRDFWIINGSHNFAYVKPAKVGSQTNLNLVTASGNIYSFVLSEISEDRASEPDMKVFVELKEESMIAALNAPAKFVSAAQLAEAKAQLETAEADKRRVKESTQEVIDKGISKFLDHVRFPYRFEAGKKPFFVRAMYNDDKFTYIQARPEETPTLYEVKDKKPNLVNFDYKNGLYVVGKILDRGYLAIGKKRLAFSREE